MCTAIVPTIRQQLRILWLVPILQTLLLPLGQRETVRRYVDRRGQLNIYRGGRRTGDVPALESATDDHTDGLGVEAAYDGGGFNDAASDGADLPLDQCGGAETISENVVVQARNPAKRINRDGTDFVENASPRRASSRAHHSLSLCSPAPAGTSAKHLDDGISSDGGKSICDGASRAMHKDGEERHPLRKTRA